MLYEKPLAEIVNFETESVMVDGEAGQGPSGVEGGSGDSPFG